MRLLFNDGIKSDIQDANIIFCNMIHFHITQKKTQSFFILLFSVPNVRKKA